MDFFERLAKEKQTKQGKFKATVTAKWAKLGSIETPEKKYRDEDAFDLLRADPKLNKLIARSFDELTIEWNDELTAVKNVSVEEWGSGGLSEDGTSIKWLEVKCHFDTDLDVVKDWYEIEDALRFGFYGDLEAETKKGWIVFRFSDLSDNSVELG